MTMILALIFTNEKTTNQLLIDDHLSRVSLKYELIKLLLLERRVHFVFILTLLYELSVFAFLSENQTINTTRIPHNTRLLY